MRRINVKPADLFAYQLKQAGIAFDAEYKFHPTRKWRLDFYFKSAGLGVEIEGAVFIGGRHVTGSGFTADCEKYNAALMLGIQIARFTSAQVRRGEAIHWVQDYLRRLASKDS